VLPAALALIAGRDSGLIRGTRSLGGADSVDDHSRECTYKLAVAHAIAALSLENLPGFAEHRHGLVIDVLVTQVSRTQLRIRWIAWLVATLVTRDHLFDVTQVLVARCLEPLLLGLRRRDARELAAGRERQVALRQCICDRRQFDDGLRDAQSLQRCAWRVAHLHLHVLEQTSVPVMPPQPQPIRLSERFGLLRIERAACFDDSFQPSMQLLALVVATRLARVRPGIVRGNTGTVITKICIVPEAPCILLNSTPRRLIVDRFFAQHRRLLAVEDIVVPRTFWASRRLRRANKNPEARRQTTTGTNARSALHIACHR
jgi:hypothetical protein